MKTRISLSLVALIAAACGDSGETGGGAGANAMPAPNVGASGPDKAAPPTPGDTNAGAFADAGGGGVKDAGRPPEGPLKIAANVGINEVAIYQAVKIPLVRNGAVVTTRAAPVVAGRAALVRVFAVRKSGYAGGAVTAELKLTPPSGPAVVLKDTKVVPATATDAQLASTFNLEVPAEALPEGVKWSVALMEAAPAATPGADAQWPAGGAPADLLADSTGQQLKIVLVPMQYNADGSGRLPDTSAAAVEKYRSTFYGVYPAAKVDITVHSPLAYSRSISATGSGWEQALNAIINLRAQERPSRDVYYYGIFAPSASFSSFCRGGCVLGLSGLGSSPTDAGVRASIGIGYLEEAASTATHEVGHAHGREHAPCGNPGGPDPRYPHSGGAIGVWGYDLVAKRLVDPQQGKDFMGYCPNAWVSDYTYKALFERVKLVNGAAMTAWPTARPFRLVNVDSAGAMTLSDALELTEPPMGDPREVEWKDAAGRTVATETAHYYPYDHLPGGFMLVPEPPPNARSLAPTH